MANWEAASGPDRGLDTATRHLVDAAVGTAKTNRLRRTVGEGLARFGILTTMKPHSVLLPAVLVLSYAAAAATITAVDGLDLADATTLPNEVFTAEDGAVIRVTEPETAARHLQHTARRIPRRLEYDCAPP